MFIFPKEVAATPFQASLFNEKLAEIAKIYQLFFQSDSQPGALTNYLRCFVLQGKIHFHIKEGLPIEIAKDCRSAFHSIFG
jgi:hypothetical protein